MPFGTDQAWGVIIPQERSNLLRNPSVERDTTDWNDPSVGFIAGRVSDTQAFGAYSVATPGNIAGPVIGLTVGPWTAGAGTAYTVSLHMRSANTETIRFGVANGADVTTPPTYLGTTNVTVGGGTWHRHSFSYTEASGGARYMSVVASDAALTGTLYMDGAQVEAGSLTTYIDGLQEGCYWTGQNHLSTSVRSGTSRAGGTVVALADLGFRVETSPGIGMPPLETTGQSFALIDGAQFQRQRGAQRTFTLAGWVQGTATQTRISLHQQRQALIDALKIDLVSPQQPTTFWYVGGPGTVQISAVMDAGMGFDLPPGQFTENPGIRFIAHDPFWYSTTDQGTALSPRVSLGSVRHIAWRDPQGRWGTMGVAGTTVQLNGGNPAINTILPLAGGTVLIGGNWGTVGGTVSPAIGRWDQATNRFGTFGGTVLRTNHAATYVHKMIQTPAGTVFFGGDFGTVAGTQGAWFIAQWTGAAFGTLIGGTLNQPVLDLLYQGTLFAGGDFTVAGGSAARFVARHVNNAWGTLTGGGSISASAQALARGLDGRIFIGGAFVQVAGTFGTGVAFWDGSYGTMGNVDGLGAFVSSLAVAPSGVAYLGGQFTSINGGSAAHLASYNGVQMFPAGSGLTATFNPTVNALLVDKVTNNIWVGGAFTNAGGIPIADGIAVYNSYAFHGPDISLTTAGTFNDIQQSQDGTIYAAGTFSSAGFCASVAQVMSAGRTETYPIVTMRTSSGTARIYQLLNTLTGDSIYFNYAILPGEEVTLDLIERTLTSSYLGNIYGKMLSGSDISTWRLMPGTNWVSFFSDSDTLAVSMYWRPKSWSADAGTSS